ncbi:MAG: PAS domain S-box protein [Candidatus Aegiribacteria sp.]|nr:PAS domain S-box protein [Candidatus Aegiribacteria sp.]
MDERTLRLLILEDNRDDAELAVKQLEEDGYTVNYSVVDTENSFREALSDAPDLILADYELSGFNCLDALLIHKDVSPEIPLILFSGTIGDEKAADCIKLGAVDYVLKDNLVRLSPAVRRALDKARICMEKSNTEMKLKESEEKYRLTVENSSDGICIVQDGRMVFLNPRVGEMLGYAHGSGIDKPFIDYFHPDDKQRIAAEYEKFAKGLENHQKIETILISSEGREINVELSISVTTHEGSRAGLVFMREITERKKMEDALRKSETQKQALLDGSPNMIILLNTDIKVLWANRTALSMNPDCIGQFCYRAFPGVEEHCDGCPIKGAVETGKIETGIKHQQTVEGIEGDSYWEDIAVPVKDGNGNVVEVMMIARNITDRVKREKDLRRKNEELEKFNSIAVSRELKMVELKKEINSLLKELGREPTFSLQKGSETEASR